MKITKHAWHSQALNQSMAVQVYGERGKPLLVFPQQDGRAGDFEGFGMVEVCRSFIDSGQLRLFTVDSVDGQSWTNWPLPPAERALRHEAYDHYITREVVPFIKEHSDSRDTRCLTTGCSMGGYHAANFFFRHPQLFDGMICLSGLFELSTFIGEHMDLNVYYNSPLHYLSNLSDPLYLEQYRHSHIIVCTGLHYWEHQLKMVSNARALQWILAAKKIPAWIDFWGEDCEHDWPWWRRQLPYFLSHLAGRGALAESVSAPGKKTAAPKRKSAVPAV